MKRGHRNFYLKIFLFFALNLFLFASITHFHHSHYPDPLPYKTLPNSHQILRPNRGFSTERNRSTALSGKRWPTLPSFLPWVQNPYLPPRSCEGFFGHGFSRRVNVLPPSEGTQFDLSSRSGWFRCSYSETLRSSICEGGRLRMDPRRIHMSRGGEALESVIGRPEEEEMPRFKPGAFAVEVGSGVRGSGPIVSEEFLDQYVPSGDVSDHAMRNLIGSIEKIEQFDEEFHCEEWIEDTTLLVARFEYANLFHTVTDWYSAYATSRVTGLPRRPNLVFVDGHCKSSLEETWEALFSSVRYAKDFKGPVCFRHAILSPLGYETALFKGLTVPIKCQGAPASELRGNPVDHKTARLSEFGEMLAASFDLPLDNHDSFNASIGHNVLFVRREDYVAHPRHGGKVESRLSNEQEIFISLQNWASRYSRCKVNIINGLFAHMPMKEQFRAIQDASVIIGAHGAGLTHVIAAKPNTVVLEIISSEYRRPHFALISQWKGLDYHAINLLGSSADPNQVIDELANILANLGC